MTNYSFRKFHVVFRDKSCHDDCIYRSNFITCNIYARYAWAGGSSWMKISKKKVQFEFKWNGQVYYLITLWKFGPREKLLFSIVYNAKTIARRRFSEGGREDRSRNYSKTLAEFKTAMAPLCIYLIPNANEKRDVAHARYRYICRCCQEDSATRRLLTPGKVFTDKDKRSVCSFKIAQVSNLHVHCCHCC